MRGIKNACSGSSSFNTSGRIWRKAVPSRAAAANATRNKEIFWIKWSLRNNRMLPERESRVIKKVLARVTKKGFMQISYHILAEKKSSPIQEKAKESASREQGRTIESRREVWGISSFCQAEAQERRTMCGACPPATQITEDIPQCTLPKIRQPLHR